MTGFLPERLPLYDHKAIFREPARIGRFDGPPMSDAVPASLVDGTPGDLKADLIALLGKENVLHRAIDLVRYASDASPYRLVPQVVVLPRTTDDIVKLFRYCRETGRHATFRAAGTSLNGQSLSDDILIDVRRHWYGGKVEDDGRRVRVRPGMILGHVNSLLERHGRRVGPDPASLAVLHDRRRDCEQRRWYAVHRAEGCLPYCLRAHFRNDHPAL